jgi:hypothetical protein
MPRGTLEEADRADNIYMGERESTVTHRVEGHCCIHHESRFSQASGTSPKTTPVG